MESIAICIVVDGLKPHVMNATQEMCHVLWQTQYVLKPAILTYLGAQ